MLTGFVHHDDRSEEVMKNIMNRIELLEGWGVSETLIHLPYSINGKPQPALTFSSPEEIAAFAEYNYLIDRWECKEGIVTMFKRMPTFIKADRWGWCMQMMEEKVQAKFPFRFSVQAVTRFVARYYYDNGDMQEIKGRVIQMHSENITNQNIA